MERIITARKELRKRFQENGFAFLSSVPQRYVQERNSSKKDVDWHYSHPVGKQVYGFQLHAAIVSTSSHALYYSLHAIIRNMDLK
mgnify:FL=1